MTDRKKAIFFLSLTFFFGLLIGSLAPAFFGKVRHRDMMEHRGGKGEWPEHNRTKKNMGNRQEWLTNTIIHVVMPDSDQVKEIRPLTKKATEQISSLEKNSNERMVSIMDSLKIKLKPILTEDQNKKLEEFSMKARSRWRKGR